MVFHSKQKLPASEMG